jgi:hypothetical protein
LRSAPHFFDEKIERGIIAGHPVDLYVMSADALKSALGRKPFEPFRIIMSSGDSYEVRHPEFAWLVRGGLYVGLPPENGDLPERAVFCSMVHITAAETLATA